MSDVQPQNQDAETLRKGGGLFGFLRRNFIAGLFVIAPAVVTFVILKALVTTLDAAILGMLPPKLQPETYLTRTLPGFGLLGGFVILVLIGMMARNFIGRGFVAWMEHLLYTIPGVRTVYKIVKQIVETLQSSQQDAFRDVVLVEYPRKGIWCLAFVTGKTKGEVQKKTDKEMINIFLPTTPNPTSGFLLFVPKKDLTYMDMTVEEGMKMIISGGIVVPEEASKKAVKKPAKK